MRPACTSLHESCEGGLGHNIKAEEHWIGGHEKEKEKEYICIYMKII